MMMSLIARSIYAPACASVALPSAFATAALPSGVFAPGQKRPLVRWIDPAAIPISCSVEPCGQAP
jgi:hypothetical protein